MAFTYPIILAHGISPFDRVIRPFSNIDNRDDDRFHYFRKIRSALIEHGFPAFHSRVSWASNLDRRASDLRKEILKITENFSKWPRIHIIAHSMGGLVSRQAVRFLQAQRRGRPFFLHLAYTAPHYGKGWDPKREKTPNILQAKKSDLARFSHIEDERRRMCLRI